MADTDGWIVVRLHDATIPAGPATVIMVTDLPISECRRQIEDRDGGIPSDLRFWRSYPGARLGDTVSLRIEGSL